MGGGKTSQTTSQVSIPPEVLARYNAVNARAEQTAQTPFQPYQGQFVAGITPTQQQGISNISQAAGQAQPYYQAATQQLQQAQQQGQQGLSAAQPFLQQGVETGQQLGQQAYGSYQSMLPSFLPSYAQAQQGLQQGLGAGQALLGGGLGYALSGAQPITPQQFSGQAINQYMSPFMSNVVGQTMAAQAQQNAQQRRALQGEAIKAGAFGGDRSGIAQANLAYQQNLANQQTLANLLQGGYGQALGAFQQQQGVNLAAEQANRQALQQTGQSLAGLGQQAFGMGATGAQQQAALGQALAGMYGQQGQGLAGLGQQQFGQGLTAAQQQAQLAQQGYGMGAGTAQALAGLGTGAQGAALQGAQAQLGAGTLEQQTQQADLTARYQQFLQERGYPFQVAQFLANIAMGTGALSGSTTTTQQPAGFFSDERLKEDAEQIGKTNDGQPIYRFKYKGDPRYQIGLMAQDVMEDHPEAVGKKDGYLTVDYKVATDDAVEHRAHGGLIPNRMGGVVGEAGDYASGGLVPRQHLNVGGDADFIKAILQSQQKSFGELVGGTPYGSAGAGTPFAKNEGYVPKANLPTSKLATAASVGASQRSGLGSAVDTGKSIADLYKFGKETYKEGQKLFAGDDKKNPPPAGGKPNAPAASVAASDKANTPSANAKPISYESGKDGYFIPGGEGNKAEGLETAADTGMALREVEPEDILFAFGGVVPRQGYAGLGKVIDPMELQDPSQGINAYIKDASESQEDTSDDKISGTGGGGGGKGRGVGDDIKDIAGLAGTVMSAGKAAASAIPAVLSVLPFSDERLKHNIEKVGELDDGQNVYRYDFGNGRTQLGLLAQEVLSKKPEAVGKRDGYLTVNYDKATEDAIKRAMGGTARKGYADEGRVEPQPAQEAPRYKIEPQNLEDMPAHRQEMIRAIYGPESGGRYDIRYGGVGSTGKTFDPEGPHPNIRERRDDGRYSTAAGAGQFIKGTWDRITGGAPMTKGYQDAATWKLASEDYTARTGRDLDADLQETGVTPEIKRSLGPTWEALAKQTGGGGGKGLVPDADMPSEKAAPVQYTGDDASAGFSIPGGSNFWLPALSLVGSMLASKSPTLGGAIGEGIVGGVAGYQVQQKMNADLAKSVLDIVKDRFNVTTDQKTGETRYFNKNTSELLTPSQFKQVVSGMATGLGVSPAVLGIVSPGQQQGGYALPGGGAERTPMAPPPPSQGGAPAAAPGQTTAAPGAAQPGTAPAEETKPVDLTRMNQTQLIDYAQKNPKAFAGLERERNPNTLQQQIENLAQREKNATNQGDTAEASRLAAERMEIQKLKDTYLREAVDLQYKTNIELTKAQTEGYNKYLEKAAGRAETYDTARSSLKRLADIYSNYEPNRAEELKTQVTDFLAGIGFNVFDRAYQNASFDEAMKTALTQAFKIVDENGLTRAPGAAMQNAVQTVPAPTLTAGGAYMLIGKALGELDYYKNKDQKFLEQPRGTQPAEFLLNYSKNYKDETPTNYTRKVFESEIRPGPGVTRQTIESARRSYGFERPAGSEPAPAAGGTQQQPATPAVPQVGAVQQGYRFLGGNPADPASWQKVQ